MYSLKKRLVLQGCVQLDWEKSVENSKNTLTLPFKNNDLEGQERKILHPELKKKVMNLEDTSFNQLDLQNVEVRNQNAGYNVCQ